MTNPKINPWVHYNGVYEKKFYDIMTMDGEKHRRCWPNAGMFHTKNGKVIPGTAVGTFKISDDQWQ